MNNKSQPDFQETNRENDIDQINADTVIPGSTPKSNAGGFGPIPGANHNEEFIDHEEINDNKGSSNNAGTGSNESFNSEFDDLDEPTKDQAAAMTAEALVHAYCEFKMLPAILLSISTRKLKKLDRADEIDMYSYVKESRYSENQIPLGKYVENFNEKLIEPFRTSEDFKTTVTPILTGILKNKGIAATPEQTLAFYVAMDMVGMVKATIAAAADRREFIDNLKDIHQARTAAAPNGPVTPDVNPTTTTADTTTIVAKIVEEEIKS